jgi:3-methyl-2-oxobutanoate hydroxymethyltransferase
MGEHRTKTTVPSVTRSKVSRGDAPLVMITAYDHPSARLADAAGVDLLLVGDSLGMVVQGRPDTLRVTVDEVCYHCRCVARAEPTALVVGDMPWLSYHVGVDDAVRNAGRLVQEGGVQAVKLEGGSQRLPVVRGILDAEIPVMGHLGLTPQSIHALGGFRVQGQEPEAAARILSDAHALQEAGVFALVLEGVPSELAARVTRELSIPTIGIGAGPDCDGQVLVFHDLLGLSEGPLPRFVRRYESLGDRAVEALRRYAGDVRSRSFPADGESYHARRPRPVSRQGGRAGGA